MTLVDARPLAMARIGLGLATGLNSLEAILILGRSQRADRIALPAWSWVPSLSDLLILMLLALLLTAAAMVVLGLLARPAAAISGLVLWSMFALEQQTYSHHMMLNGWLLLWLSLSQADAAWSIRARGQGRRPVPLWNQLLLMSQLSVCYFFAALVKVNPTFLSGEYLASVTDLALPPWMFIGMATATVMVEFSLAFLLWVPRVRRFVAVAGVLLHLAIPLSMTPRAPFIAFSITCLSLYPLFFSRQVPERSTGGQQAARAEMPMGSAGNVGSS